MSVATSTLQLDTSGNEPEVHSVSTTTPLPPTPPETDVESEDGISKATDLDISLPPSSTAQRVLEVDKSTPDAHVPRDPRLIRLTGVHPFNVEAPLSDLYNEGFLTSTDLFYVRNHGAVPEVQDIACLDWEISVEGLVANPLRITLRQLLEEYENVTYPITLVCAGNRRKEQNVVRKTKGFSWGPAGVSTALFTGVVMRDVIEKAKPLRRAKYVCMEGADKLPNGYYGTSVKLNWAMDPNRGIMLAHKMNGENLTPDHGKPLRVVVPGQIGGRSVKWLKRLIITAEPSDNWYHIYDNRVLPTMIDPEESAKNTKWWTDERYAIYDLSPNSAIAYPSHDEQISLTTAMSFYNVRGYAYSGGGRRVTRCEVSLDKGKTWRLAKIEYAEDRYRDVSDRELFGGRLDMDWRETSFCWCFWSLEIAFSDLTAASDILVRAMDEAMCIQPRDMYWSVLGMMNNPWFRITIHNENGSLRFEHPTQPALMPGGWMDRVKKEGGDLANGYWGEKMNSERSDAAKIEKAAEIKMTKDGVDTIIELDELRAHINDTNPWFVLNGDVYDGTAFLESHPGGAQSIVSAAALDTTEEFLAIHSETAKAMMPDYHIGRLSSTALVQLASNVQQTISPPSDTMAFLSPRIWNTAHLQSKTPISHNTYIFTFALTHPTQPLGLPTGQHLLLRLQDATKTTTLIRPYTPTTPGTHAGTVDLLVKIYPHGALTSSLATLPLGTPVALKGPVGKFTYHAHGRFSLHSTQRTARRFAMLCAGTGITPMLAVLRAVLQEPGGTTECVLLECARSEADVLCAGEVDALVRGSGGRGRVVRLLSSPGDGWVGERGWVCKEVLDGIFGEEGGEGTVVLVCGPKAWEEKVEGLLVERGYKGDDVVFL